MLSTLAQQGSSTIAPFPANATCGVTSRPDCCVPATIQASQPCEGTVCSSRVSGLISQISEAEGPINSIHKPGGRDEPPVEGQMPWNFRLLESRSIAATVSLKAKQPSLQVAGGASRPSHLFPPQSHLAHDLTSMTDTVALPCDITSQKCSIFQFSTVICKGKSFRSCNFSTELQWHSDCTFCTLHVCTQSYSPCTASKVLPTPSPQVAGGASRPTFFRPSATRWLDPPPKKPVHRNPPKPWRGVNFQTLLTFDLIFLCPLTEFPCNILRRSNNTHSQSTLALIM